ncbi:cytochrome c biogenesis protein ResB [Glaciihabitans arcticus]|uniref:Cytochrome c biogenesis protein ResB n=1 Tax=Glaciihabitans arcticus TaxID=2668039 RepID=A0A4Q9GZE3_9MICO|nr:cytochrome c biogenesis protein ResB [Glaciihabitans arcticus]
MDSPAPDPGIAQPRLGVIGYLRFFWRQLTSMRTALFLLLLLAFAAIPGSLVPQRSADPNGVIAYQAAYPDLFPVLDALQVFDTYSSVWFSSIYLLLFVSLIGCIIPRTKFHLNALRARPPKTPARLERLAGFTTRTTDATPEAALASARALLRKSGYRVEQYGSSVSAERGYLRETGNLVFHTALVGILVAAGIGGGFVYTGQRVIVEGQKFVNVRADYDAFNPGRFVTSAVGLQPYRISLDRFESVYELENQDAVGQATDYTAYISTTVPGQKDATATIKVNEPLRIQDTDVYLLGNGYAPTVVVRDPEGKVVWTDSTPFLPQDAKLTSSGVIKIPDGLAEQVGMIGFFYPTAAKLDTGAFTSGFPGLLNPMLSLRVYTGDLGLDDGVGRSVYQLNPTGLTPIAGDGADVPAIQLGLGDKVDLPGGLGSIELTEVKRFASFDIHHDPTQIWVLVFALLILGGLLTGLFIPRRRVWVKAKQQADGTTLLEYAGLARGEDPRLDEAVADLATAHAANFPNKV